MNRRERAARHFIPAHPRDGGAAPLHRLLAESPPAGLLFFRKDGGDTAGLARRIAEVRALSGRPLLATIDEEGGFVTQIAPDLPPAPSARVLGRLGDDDVAERFGRETGRALGELGIDVDFAPVFDVDREPANPVIGPRAFSADAHAVERLALAFARGLDAAGVLWCAKHFPGHGSTGLDSHLALPVDASPRTTLDSVHLRPFRAAINAGAPIVMVSHVTYPALEPSGAPATLSRAVVTNLLRRDLGFDGVVVTDAMEMRAVADHLPSGEAAVRALEAGCDLVLYGTYDGAVEAAIDAVVEAIESGRLSESLLQESERRIERVHEATRRGRAATRAGVVDVSLGESERVALMRRALRAFEPAVLAAPEQQPSHGAGVIVEPAWPAGAPLAHLVGEAIGASVRSIPWEQVAGEDLTAPWVVFAHARRIAPTPTERAALAQAHPGRDLVVALGQDAFLADYPALHRLSACDPSETMRRAVAEAVVEWLRAGGRPAAGQPGTLASR
jgi:beta-glucosidase-like glycosyl hydrolase